MASEDGIATAAPMDDQLQSIHQILGEKERPLSWKAFGRELEKCNSSLNCQSVRDALCKKSVPGILSSRDFITLDTPRNVGLLKLQLVVAVNEKINGGRFSSANHYFHMIAFNAEKDELGHNEDTLAKSVLEFSDIFTMTSLSSRSDSYKKVLLEPESFLLHKSFFACEKDSKASAIHKLKYFLFLCHGSTDVTSAFEFSRCLLAKEEKHFLARNTVDDFKKAVKPLSLSIHINGSMLAMSQSLSPIHEKQTKGNDADPKPKQVSDVLGEKDIALFRDVLHQGPLSWKVFLSRLESRRPNTYSIALREMFCQLQPDGLIHSPDFVSLNNAKSTALAKLHFIVCINNKLGSASLGKVSFHFNVLGSTEERTEFGKNSDGILQSLMEYKDVFLLPPNGGNQHSVKCGPMAIPFDSFFQMEGRSEESFNHKLKYFVNLCGGTCIVSTAFEFSRNLLSSDEKRLFMCNKESFFELVSSQKSFILIADRIQLCKSHLWSTRTEAPTLLSGDPEISNLEEKDITKSTSVMKRKEMPLTEDFVKDILKTQGYPMSWTEFKKKFLMLDESPENTVQAFMRQYSTKIAKSLCLSEDFVALNTPFHRNRLKLQLILEIQSRWGKPKRFSLTELQEQFEEVASDQEIGETQLGCQDLEEFLCKFPKVFIVKDGFVRQGSSALKFQSFFAKEKDGALTSVLNKLRYFVNICGDYCDIQFACKFLQKHLRSRKEVELADTDAKVFSLIHKIQFGHQGSEVGKNNEESMQAQINNETPEERKSTAEEKLRKIKSILEKRKHAALWRNLDGKLYKSEEREQWVAEFIEIYLPTLEPCPLICTEEFVSLDTPEDRAFLKVCLMVNMNTKCKKNCTLESLYQRTYDIASGVERRSLLNGMESFLKSFPSVFAISGKSPPQRVVRPGKDMLHFEDLFGPCAHHSEEFCLRCLLESFVYMSGGTSHFNKAFTLMKLMVKMSHRMGVTSIAKMDTSYFKTLIKSCDRIHLNQESMLKLLSINSNNSTASKVEKKETSEHNHDAPWPIGTWKNDEEGSSKKVSEPPPSQEKLPALLAPSEGTTASSSIRQKDGDQVQSTPEEDALSTTSSTVSKSARKRANKKKKEAAAAIVSMTTKPKVDVHVQVIKDDLTLDQLIKKMQNHNRPIMSVVHSTDALVVVDWFGVGFILPVPKKGFAESHRWRRLHHFFRDPKIVMVTFDCERVGRFLWQRMSLKLVTVFDIKSGVWLMYPETENCMHTCNSVGEICRHFGREGPDSLNAEIIGNLEFDEEQIQLDREESLSAIQSAAVLVPSVYSWIFKELESRLALNELHTLTMEKLKLLDAMTVDDTTIAVDDTTIAVDDTTIPVYDTTIPVDDTTIPVDYTTIPVDDTTIPVDDTTIPVDDTTMPARIDSSASTTPLPPSNESGSSVSSSHSYDGENAMMPSIEQSTSFATSISQNGMIPSQSLVPELPAQNNWFSEEFGDPADIPVALEITCDPETYCLRKVEGSTIAQVPQEEAANYDSNLSNLTFELIHQYSQSNTENIVQLLTLLGDDLFTTLSSKLKDQSERTVEDLSEITLHVGRVPSARFHQTGNSEGPVEVDASSQVTTRKDLEEIEMKDALTGFDDYNRCGVEGCLHSIRGIRNRKKKLIGLTVRVALPLLGCADMMYDIALSDKSTLILGRPGVGKTTLLRELARCLSVTEGNKVVVIDTCNEIAGDCDTPHFSIGRASRLQVDSPENQHQVIAESAKNHNPDVVIIDLVELPSDVSAIACLRKKGIKVIAGVSSDSVTSLLHDENLSQMFKVRGSDFLDDMSSLDSAGALARSKLRPVFEAVVEMKETDRWHIQDLMYTLSKVSNNQAYKVQERTRIGLTRRLPGSEQEILLRERVINPQDT